MRLKILSLLLAISIIFLLFGCTKSKQSVSFYEYFDTVSTVISYAKETKHSFEANSSAVKDLLEKYHVLFDIYYEYSGINNLKTVNDNAGKSPVKVDQKLIDFLIYSKEMYTLTKGKTNIAMGSVLKVWHNYRQSALSNPKNAAVPTPEELNEAAKHTDINDLIIDKENSTVYLADDKMSLDVGAIGKGYATEKAAELLISRGVTSYVLNIGGNIRAIGKKNTGDGWITGITNPNTTSDERFVCRVEIKDVSLVTSGNYERYYVANDVRYHHIIDPQTLMPAKYFSSVSVFTKDSGLADALSTALFCMSYEEGIKLVSELTGVEVIWVDTNYSVKMTDGVELYTNNGK